MFSSGFTRAADDEDDDDHDDHDDDDERSMNL